MIGPDIRTAFEGKPRFESTHSLRVQVELEVGVVVRVEVGVCRLVRHRLEEPSLHACGQLACCTHAFVSRSASSSSLFSMLSSRKSNFVPSMSARFFVARIDRDFDIRTRKISSDVESLRIARISSNLLFRKRLRSSRGTEIPTRLFYDTSNRDNRQRCVIISLCQITRRRSRSSLRLRTPEEPDYEVLLSADVDTSSAGSQRHGIRLVSTATSFFSYSSRGENESERIVRLCETSVRRYNIDL